MLPTKLRQYQVVRRVYIPGIALSIAQISSLPSEIEDKQVALPSIFYTSVPGTWYVYTNSGFSILRTWYLVLIK